VGLAGPDAVVVFASDHGFGPTSDILYLNTWLEQQGYLTWAGDRGSPPDASHQVGINQIARHVFELDWERTVAYAATPSSQGIHIVRQAPGCDAGVPPESYERVRGELAEALLRFRHPLTSRPVVADVWVREEVFAGPFEPWAPDLTVRLEDDGVVSILRSETTVARRGDPVGTHRPEGIFLARGPGLRQGASLAEISIMDVAPLILHCLEIPAPGDMTGRLPVAVFEPDELRRRPPRAVALRPSASLNGADHPVKTEIAYEPEEEQLVLKRLAALGYLE
jgi:predicted AlkP superfamily phosphohydrolase/phosphomutase